MAVFTQPGDHPYLIPFQSLADIWSKISLGQHWFQVLWTCNFFLMATITTLAISVNLATWRHNHGIFISKLGGSNIIWFSFIIIYVYKSNVDPKLIQSKSKSKVNLDLVQSIFRLRWKYQKSKLNPTLVQTGLSNLSQDLVQRPEDPDLIWFIIGQWYIFWIIVGLGLD